MLGPILTTSKSDIGAYAYGAGAGCASNFAGPHAVSAVAGTKNANYCYDNNGNLTQGDSRTVAWTAFNMPSLIQQNARQVAITYGPDRGRFKRVDLNETGTSTTYYVAGGTHEVVESGTTVTHKTYIGGAAVVIETTSAPTSTETIYLLHDHLGSTDVVTAADGTVQTRNSFDAWGRRRDVTWAAFFPTVPASLWQTYKTTRGFTGHEQLDEVGLVHMNGRVYDPELGRFLSADPFVQDATDLQAFNRYAYVRNNPLSLTDPSGFFSLGGIFKAIGNFFASAFRAIEHAVKAILSNSIVRAVIQIAVCAAAGSTGVGIGMCAAAGAALTAMSGGTPLQALESFAMTFVSAGVWGGVHGFLQGAATWLGDAYNAARLLVHGTVAGALSVAQGGSFLHGFAAGVAGEGVAIASGPGTALGNLQGDEGRFARSFMAGAAGGTASVLTGGKFANGAVTAAFAMLYNGYAGRMAGGALGGTIAGALGIETGPFDAIFIAGGRYLGGVVGSAVEDVLLMSGEPPKDYAPDDAKRQGAFNEAKRLNGIPTSQQPDGQGPNLDRNGNPQPGRQYTFTVAKEGGGTETIVIRDDAAGHYYGPRDPQNIGPHFNDPSGRHFGY